MTIKDITHKNLKYNGNMYGAFLFSSSLCVYMFFLLLMLLFNKEFVAGATSGTLVGIFSVVQVVIALFAMIFIPFCYRSLMVSRAKDFGLYMLMGIEKKQLGQIILVESLWFAGGSLLIGLIAGAMSSYFFYLLIVRFLQMDLSNMSFKWSGGAFLITIAFFLFLFCIATYWSLRTYSKKDIIYFIKVARKKKRTHEKGVWLGVLGIGIIMVSIFVACSVTVSNLRGQGFSVPLYLVSVITCLWGFYLSLSNFGASYLAIVKKRKSYYYKNVLQLSQLHYRFFDYKLIVFLVSLLSAIVVFLFALLIGGLTSLNYRMDVSSPYDLEVTIPNDNIVGEGLYQVLQENKELVQDLLHLEGFEIGGIDRVRGGDRLEFRNMHIMSEGDAEKVLGIDLQLEDFEGVYIVNYLPRADTYDRVKVGDVFISEHGMKLDVVSFMQQPITEVYPNSLIVNTSTYGQLQNLAKVIKNYYMFNIDTKYHDQLFNQLLGQIDQEQNIQIENIWSYYDYVYSKMVYMDRLGQANRIMSFGFIYPAILFIISTGCVLYFVIIMDRQLYHKQYKQLIRIGITESEYKAFLSKELRPLFMLPSILGGIVGGIYLLTLYYVELYTLKYMILSILLVIGLFLALNYAFFLYCRRAILSYRMTN